jgi:hypothetical protein
MIRLFSISLVVLGLACGTGLGQLPSDARFAYEWNVNNTPITAPSLSATVGTSFTLQVYLKQTAGALDVFQNQGGLFGGGVRATYGGNPGGGVNAGVIVVANSGTTANTNGITYNPLFNDVATSNSSLVANANYAQFLAATTGASGVPATSGRVLLGTFVFQVTGTAGQSTILTADRTRDNNTGSSFLNSNVTFNNGWTLDPVITAHSLTINVVPVPEPASMILVGAAGMGVVAGIRRWRKRRAATAPPEPAA